MFYFNPPPLTELASGCRVADYDDDDACDFVVTWVVAEDAEKMMRLRRSRRLISHLAAAASTLSPADAEDALRHRLCRQPRRAAAETWRGVGIKYIKGIDNLVEILN